MANFLVVDVGGTKILAAAIADDGQILARHKLKTPRDSREGLLEQLDIALDAALGAANLSKNDISGLALGVPGVVDAARGHVVLTPNAPLSDTPLRELLAQKWSCPIVVGNDVNIGMAGEVSAGAARGASSAFGIFVGTGIGGGLFIDGKLIEGFRGLGGEIGHLMVPLGADEIAGMLTKKHTFLEDLCSRTAIENQLRHAIVKEGKKSALTEIVGDKKLERIRSGALKEALKRGDPLVTDVMRRASYLIGLATASVLHIVDPEVIVLGGGVIEACGKWMVPWVEKTVQKVAMPGTGRPVQIVQSSLGDDAILLGGLALLKLEDGGVATPPADFRAARPVVLASVDKPLD
ncbi:MAG TPA: ROK family protein [Abditibacterium sp.]|jgi:glucokinase